MANRGKAFLLLDYKNRIKLWEFEGYMGGDGEMRIRIAHKYQIDRCGMHMGDFGM